MKSLRKVVLFAGMLAALSLIPMKLLAADFYVAQNATGLGAGMDCANAFPISWLNNDANWASPKIGGKIGPGDTVRICGTISCDGSSSAALIAKGSGAPGSPITIYFEPGAKMSAPVCGSWISLLGKNYITVDGGTNGIIENTANGTSLANQAYSVGVHANDNSGSTEIGNGITVRNLTIKNLYVKTQGVNETNFPGNSPTGVTLAGSNVSVENVTVDNAANGVTVNFTPNATSASITNCQFLGCNWGAQVSTSSEGVATNFTFANNVYDGFDVWEDPSGNFHRNGMYLFIQNPLTNIYIYNNRFGPGFDPQTATAGTNWVQFSRILGGAGEFNNVYIFNNVSLLKQPLTTGWSGGGLASSGSNILIANNDFITNSGGGNIMAVRGASNIHLYNNIIYSTRFGVNIRSASSSNLLQDSTVKSDYNIYYAISSGWGSFCLNSANGSCDHASGTTLATWQSATSRAASGAWEAHSSSSDPLMVNSSAVIGTGDYRLQSVSSPAYRAGLNLSDFVATLMAGDSMARAAGAALSKDHAGNSRPASGNGSWDIGAYQYQESMHLSKPENLKIAK